MDIGKIVSEKLRYEGKQQTWLADKLDISKTTLGYKLKNDTLTAMELIKIDILLNLGLEKIRKEVEEEMKEREKENNLEIISEWIRGRATSGYYPTWELELNKDFSEIDDEVFDDIADMVLEGITSGECQDISWSISIE